MIFLKTSFGTPDLYAETVACCNSHSKDEESSMAPVGKTEVEMSDAWLDCIRGIHA